MYKNKFNFLLFYIMSPKLSLREKVLAHLCLCLGVLIYTAGMITIPLFIFGNFHIRATILCIVIFQLFFAKRSDKYKSFLRSMNSFNYFKSFRLHFEEEPKDNNCLFAFHPHGCMGVGVSQVMATNDFFYNNTIVCVSRALTYVPISGLFAKLMGVEGVDNKTFERLMKEGKNLSFLPGGFEEATLTTNHRERVYIKNRKGFVKFALKYGYSIYPCYTFGENNLFRTFTPFEKFRLMLNKIKIPGTFFISKYLCLPSNEVDLFTVVGRPIELPKIEKPTSEDVERYHDLYIKELVDVFDRHKEGRVAKGGLEIN
jgi:hypothetical protein